MSKTPPPPEHLADAGRRLWTAILTDFDIAEAHHLELLARGCEQADRLQALRQQLAQGVTPALLSAERATANLQRLLLRELNLDSTAVSATTERHRLPRGLRYGA